MYVLVLDRQVLEDLVTTVCVLTEHVSLLAGALSCQCYVVDIALVFGGRVTACLCQQHLPNVLLFLEGNILYLDLLECFLCGLLHRLLHYFFLRHRLDFLGSQTRN